MHSVRSLKKRYSPRLIPGHPSHEMSSQRKPNTIYASLFFELASRPWLILSRMFSRSCCLLDCPMTAFLHQRTLSSLSLLTTTFEAAIGMGTDWPLLFSRTTVGLVSVSIRQAGDVGTRTAVDVEDVFQAVDRGDLALAALERSTHNCDLVLISFSFCRNGMWVRGGIRLFARECCSRQRQSLRV